MLLSKIPSSILGGGDLPAVLHQLANPPGAGTGVHPWLFTTALLLHRHRLPNAIENLRATAVKGCGRTVSVREISDAVKHSARPLLNCGCSRAINTRKTSPIPMILPYFNTTSIPFPVDKTKIRTSLPLAAAVANCMPESLHLLPPDIRPSIRNILPSATVSRNSRALPGTRQAEVTKVPTRTIYVDGYDTVTLHATKDPTWRIHTIQFNPGNTLNGHNGYILTEEEFLRALTLLGQLVQPLLAKPDDWLRVIPGVITDSPSHWLSLEIPYQIPDDTGEILKAFQNAKHSRINLPPLYTRNGQSVAFSNAEGDLLIRIYRKDIEMASKRGGRKGSSSTSVLRLEVALEGDELEHYMPCATWEIIEGTQRLVSFRPDHLRQAHHAVMTQFQGSYTRMPAADGMSENDERMGRFMGWITHETGKSFDDQFAYIRQRYLSRNKPASIRNAKSLLHRAARKELELLSPVKLEELFSESAWNSQPGVSARKLEAITHARHDQIETHPLVREAYGGTSL